MFDVKLYPTCGHATYLYSHSAGGSTVLSIHASHSCLDIWLADGWTDGSG